MKALLLLTFLMAGISAAPAQTNCAVKKAFAYYNVSMPGTRMADENGNPISPKANITRVLYIEYNGTKIPEIRSVLYCKAALNCTIIRLTEKTVTVGDKKLNPGNTITAKKGNSLLQVSLWPPDGKEMPEPGCKNISVKIKAAGKTCTLTLSSEKEFFSPPRY